MNLDQGSEFRLDIVEFDFNFLTETVNLGLWSGIMLKILQSSAVCVF